MSTQRYLARKTAPAVAGMLASGLIAQAQPLINMQLNPSVNPVLYTSSVGLTAPGGTLAPGGYDIGVYQIDVNSVDPSITALTGLTAHSTFNSVCLSPNGEVNWNTAYNFTYQSFSEASPGLNPSGYWSTPYGIQNAAYLWNEFAGTVQNGDQGAALSLAMLEVLYNGGKTYGSLVGSDIYGTGTSYQPNFNGDTAAENAYNTYVNYYQLNADLAGPAGEAANTQTYGLFVPTADSGAGQEFIFLSPNGQNGNPVPEPATVVSAALLLLLPFGASALRIIRKKPSTS